ncbi:hypothetical protein AB0F46_18745 [Streptomyces sp. NPDC026665]|uniref:hypothetical protein n=1 Tax=Streptomyces sp. NPDC026665 TaxID=3154798 RepID=UPI0033F2A6ED
MNAPIPRPPGPWRALARDAHLNPEEAAARAAALDECHRVAGSEPLQPPAAPHTRLIRYQSEVDRAGWKGSFVKDTERSRIEGFHPTGAAVMATARAGRDYVNLYVLPANPTGRTRWVSVSNGSFAYFLEHLALPARVRGFRVPYLCRCRKTGRYPTEAVAGAVMVDIKIKRVLKAHSTQVERRAYRCPDDDRVWHLTHWARQYIKPKPATQKGIPA